jgi:hypothetical protein
MRHQFSKAESRLGGKIAGTKTAELKVGIHGIPPKQHRENSARGGLTQGPIQGRRNVESGQLDRIRELPQTKQAQSLVGKRNGRALGLKYGPLVDMDKVRTTEGCRKGQIVGGPLSRHSRWHVNRNIFNFKCEYCLVEIERKENWGIPVMDPNE